MLTWREFEQARPDLAQAGRDIFYQVGAVGLGFLSTVRKDGGPRVHPMCPLIHDGRLLAFLIPSPKANDLIRDPRYAMHTFPCDTNEDAFYVTGAATLVRDAALRAAADAQFWTERPFPRDPNFDEQRLFEFLIETAMLTRTSGHGDPSPVHTIWKASP
ncbi:MAG TPA: pyridoxamine 5'-phosphate oxidase family protein [Dehalococcoidia bacterium]